MAVIIQEVVGHRFRDRFYPTVSGVARSYNYYPLGACRREDGVAQPGAGAGQDHRRRGACLVLLPLLPAHPAPLQQLARAGQEHPDPLLGGEPGAARRSTTPPRRTSTWCAGICARRKPTAAWPPCARPGTRPPIAWSWACPAKVRASWTSPRCCRAGWRRLPELIVELLAPGPGTVGGRGGDRVRPGFGPAGGTALAFRLPAGAAHGGAAAGRQPGRDPAGAGPGPLAPGYRGGGDRRDPARRVREAREPSPPRPPRRSPAELAGVNARLGRTPYVLIGFGRWGSADPWLGIPVVWSQISGARAIVEASLPRDEPRAQPGLALLPQPVRPGHPLFHGVRSRGDRLGGAGADAGGRGPGLTSATSKAPKRCASWWTGPRGKE